MLLSNFAYRRAWRLRVSNLGAKAGRYERRGITTTFDLQRFARRVECVQWGVASSRADGTRHRAADAMRCLPRAGRRRRRLRNCWAKLSLIAPPYCPRLGIPFAYDPGPGLLSMQAITDPPAYARARAAVRYDEVARTLVHALKYRTGTDLAPAMGRWMARAGRRTDERADALIPVPLHWRAAGAAATTSPAHSPASSTAKPGSGCRLKCCAASGTAQQIGLSRAERAQQRTGRVQGCAESKSEIAAAA